ncbi:MAG: hypothetical protein JSS11_11495 [Verrucomicrobia bacterium]|nr:hypothetical protein [Verrucomicrobiota bacterium]
MSLSRKLAVFGVIVMAAGAFWIYTFTHGFSEALHEQSMQNAAAKPLFEAVVTKKLTIGDSLEHVKEVLRYAGLDFSVVRETLPHSEIQSIYRVSPHSGFTIHLEFDSYHHLSKIDIHEYLTGP